MTDLTAARQLADAADKAAEWEPINTAPRGGEWFIARTVHGQTRVVHYADEYDRFPVSHDGVCWNTEPIEWTALAPVLSIATDAASRQLVPDLAATIRALADEVERLRAYGSPEFYVTTKAQADHSITMLRGEIDDLRKRLQKALGDMNAAEARATDAQRKLSALKEQSHD